jgi:hypothetical protein
MAISTTLRAKTDVVLVRDEESAEKWIRVPGPVYSARISQSGGNDPTAAGEVNKTDETATYAYATTGEYTLTFGGEIAEDVESIKISVCNGEHASTTPSFVHAKATGLDTISIKTYDKGGSAADDCLDSCSFMIWVDEE